MLTNTIFIALKAIWTNKSRSLLTMLGIIIGVGSVVLLTSIGNGLQAYITGQFESLGSNNIIIMPGNVFEKGKGFSQDSGARASALSNNKLKLTDVNDIKRLTDFVDKIVPLASQADELVFMQQRKSVTVIGTFTEVQDVLNLKTAKGHFFDKQTELGADLKVVLGFQIAEEAFGKIDPVGKKVKIGNKFYIVVGVVEKKGGGFGGPSFDSYAYIPLKTYSKVYDNEKILEIIVKSKDKNQIAGTIDAIEKTLLKRLDKKDFSVFDQAEILSTINQILGMLTIGLGGIAAISLVVGGIGIMNIMLVSVTERTREIGLRKALGATPNQILLQFLIEAALLSVIGGGIGLLLAYLGSLAIQSVFPAKVTMDAVILAFGVSTVVGLVFGAAPANRAARLSPIEALRYE